MNRSTLVEEHGQLFGLGLTDAPSGRLQPCETCAGVASTGTRSACLRPRCSMRKRATSHEGRSGSLRCCSSYPSMSAARTSRRASSSGVILREEKSSGHGRRTSTIANRGHDRRPRADFGDPGRHSRDPPRYQAADRKNVGYGPEAADPIFPPWCRQWVVRVYPRFLRARHVPSATRPAPSSRVVDGSGVACAASAVRITSPSALS